MRSAINNKMDRIYDRNFNENKSYDEKDYARISYILKVTITSYLQNAILRLQNFRATMPAIA